MGKVHPPKETITRAVEKVREKNYRQSQGNQNQKDQCGEQEMNTHCF